jgi:hypothetical protein
MATDYLTNPQAPVDAWNTVFDGGEGAVVKALDSSNNPISGVLVEFRLHQAVGNGFSDVTSAYVKRSAAEMFTNETGMASLNHIKFVQSLNPSRAEAPPTYLDANESIALDAGIPGTGKYKIEVLCSGMPVESALFEIDNLFIPNTWLLSHFDSLCYISMVVGVFPFAGNVASGSQPLLIRIIGRMGTVGVAVACYVTLNVLQYGTLKMSASSYLSDIYVLFCYAVLVATLCLISWSTVQKLHLELVQKNKTKQDNGASTRSTWNLANYEHREQLSLLQVSGLVALLVDPNLAHGLEKQDDLFTRDDVAKEEPIAVDESIFPHQIRWKGAFYPVKEWVRTVKTNPVPEGGLKIALQCHGNSNDVGLRIGLTRIEVDITDGRTFVIDKAMLASSMQTDDFADNAFYEHYDHFQLSQRILVTMALCFVMVLAIAFAMIGWLVSIDYNFRQARSQLLFYKFLANKWIPAEGAALISNVLNQVGGDAGAQFMASTSHMLSEDGQNSVAMVSSRIFVCGGVGMLTAVFVVCYAWSLMVNKLTCTLKLMRRGRYWFNPFDNVRNGTYAHAGIYIPTQVIRVCLSFVIVFFFVFILAGLLSIVFMEYYWWLQCAEGQTENCCLASGASGKLCGIFPRTIPKIFQIGLVVTIVRVVFKIYLQTNAIKRDPNASGQGGKVNFIEDLALYDFFSYFMLFMTLPAAAVSSVVAFFAAVLQVMVSFSRCDLPEADSILAPAFKSYKACVRLMGEAQNPVSQSFCRILNEKHFLGGNDGLFANDCQGGRVSTSRLQFHQVGFISLLQLCVPRMRAKSSDFVTPDARMLLTSTDHIKDDDNPTKADTADNEEVNDDGVPTASVLGPLGVSGGKQGAILGLTQPGTGVTIDGRRSRKQPQVIFNGGSLRVKWRPFKDAKTNEMVQKPRFPKFAFPDDTEKCDGVILDHSMRPPGVRIGGFTYRVQWVTPSAAGPPKANYDSIDALKVTRIEPPTRRGAGKVDDNDDDDEDDEEGASTKQRGDCSDRAVIELQCGSFYNPRHNRILPATICTPVHGVVGATVFLKQDGVMVGTFANPAIRPVRAIGHGRHLVPWLPETKETLKRVLPYDQLLEGFRNVDRPADGLLSAKEFTIFSRIQGDKDVRVAGMQNKLSRVVNLQSDASPGDETAAVESHAFIADDLADIIGERTHLDALRHGSHHTVSVEHLESNTQGSPPPLVFFRGDEYEVEWVGIPRKLKKSDDVFRITDVTDDLVHLEGPDSHGAFKHKDQVEVCIIETDVFLVVNGQH